MIMREHSRYVLFVLGIVFGLFVLVWLQGGLVISRGGLGEETYIGSGDSTFVVEGTLLVSPYGTEKAIIDLIASPAYTLDMWMYQLTYDKVLTVLRNLGFLGVDVDIVLESSTFGGSSKEYTAAVDRLPAAAIVDDSALGTNFVHAKAILLDESVYIISTANLSYTSFRQNREYRFVGQQPAIAESLLTIFEKDHSGDILSVHDIHPALLVCPVDCRQKITDAIGGADERLWIQAQYIEDEAIVAAVRKKQSEGVDVRVLVGKYQSPGWLEIFGTGVRMYDDYYLHAKNILVDDEMLIMGSANLSTNALDNNREISIMINDSDLVEQFTAQFMRDWLVGE